MKTGISEFDEDAFRRFRQSCRKRSLWAVFGTLFLYGCIGYAMSFFGGTVVQYAILGLGGLVSAALLWAAFSFLGKTDYGNFELCFWGSAIISTISVFVAVISIELFNRGLDGGGSLLKSFNADSFSTFFWTTLGVSLLLMVCGCGRGH